MMNDPDESALWACPECWRLTAEAFAAAYAAWKAAPGGQSYADYANEPAQ